MLSTEETKLETITTPLVSALFQTALHLTGNRESAEKIVYRVCVAASPSSKRELFRCVIRATRRRNRGWLGLSGYRRQTHAADPATRALARIPVPLREVLLLIDCQDFSYKDAADILETSVERVAQEVALARNKLNLELSAEHSSASTTAQEKVGSV